jgi:UDP-N-acetylmuramoyl-L-alanyl-D-glutamate--2,6-diaminopimelate ligase
MRLSSLLAPGVDLVGAGDIDIAGLSADSRTVVPGALFAALAGSRANGSQFIDDAIGRGAAALLVGRSAAEDAVSRAKGRAVVVAEEPRRALAQISARFYPRQPATIVAVTGTNGKTSIAEFTRQIWAHLGVPAASLGTLGVVKPGGAVYGSLTTPDPITLHRTLQDLADEGVTHLAMEASSHGLDQHRLDGVRLTAGAFNNLGRDHLDYHPTMAAYLEAKLGLFRRLLEPGRNAVVNLDGAGSDQAVEAAVQRGLTVMTTGAKGGTLRLRSVLRAGFAQEIEVEHADFATSLSLDLVGDYQVSNALVAAALAMAGGIDARRALTAIGALKGVPGRLEIVGRTHGGLAVVDYAHKPEALDAALSALRAFATGRLVCVFGCGGDRDRGKRPIMGRIAVDKADIVIVTDDNPRSEMPAQIRAEILASAPGARDIGDRAEAIAAGVDMLGPGDVLLVAGKGHETGQIVGTRTFPFSDHEAIRAAITARGHA